MDVVFPEVFVFDPQFFRILPDEAPGGLHRFFHDVADLPGQLDIAFSGVTDRFDIENLTADRGVGEAIDDSGVTRVTLRFPGVFGGAEDFLDKLRGNSDRGGVIDGHFCGDGATDAADLTLEVPDSGFAGVVFDDEADRGFRPAAMPYLQPVFLQLALHEVAARDFDLFLLRVAGEGNDLHPVPQGSGDGIDRVRGRDENDLTEVKGDVEVAIGKVVILSRVENFEESTRGVTAEVVSDLVDLVEHENGVSRSGTADFLDEAPRHGADVSATVTADLRFVPQSADGNAGELASQCFGDGSTEAGFAYAGRAEETENGAAPIRVELTDGEILKKTALHFFEAKVIPVENLRGPFEIFIVVAELAPGKLGHGFQVADNNRMLGTGRRNDIETFQFPLRGFHRGFGKLSCIEPIAEVFALFFGTVTFAELSLNRPQLLTEVGAALCIGKFVFDICAKLLLQLGDVKLIVQHGLNFLRPLSDVSLLQKRLLLDDIQTEIRCQKISENRG